MALEEEGRLRGAHPYWAALVALAVTAAALLGFAQVTRERDEARFRNATEGVQDSLGVRLDAYISILLATRSLFISRHGDVDLATFRSFVANLHIDPRYPGIQGVGFSRRLLPTEVETVRQELDRQGQEPFRVWPDHSPGEHYPVVFLEPLDRRNRAALGFDMFSEAVRHEAMSRARDTGEPAASGKVMLVQEIDPQKQAGFLIYVPVYRAGALPADAVARREALLGFVYAPFRADHLMAGIFGSQDEPRVAFNLYDGQGVDGSRLMYRGVAPDGSGSGRSAVIAFTVAGRPWTLHVESTPAFAAASNGRFLPYLVFLALLVNGAFLLVVREQVRARKEEAAAQERLGILAEASKRFSEAQLDLRAVLRTVCQEVAHRLTESCTINLVHASGERLDLAEVCHLDPGTEEEVRRILSSTPIPMGQTSVGRVAATGQPLLVPVVPLDAALTSAQEQYREHLRRYPIGSLLIVPLRVGDRVIGTATSGRRPGLPPFTVEDQRLLQDIADRAGFAIENARLAEQLRASTEAAQQAVRLRDEFLSIAGHELRTPLAALQLQVEGLQRQVEKGAFGPVPPRLTERLGKARAHVERLEVLIAGLLDVSRIAAGRLALQLEEVDLSGLLADVIDRFSDHLHRANCEVSIEANDRVVGHWDRVRLDQVLTNLVGNAVKYGAGKPIAIKIARDDGLARIAVHDRGIGIAAEDSGRVFGRFERAVSERNYGGLGLGLWISKQIVESHGGKIQLQSQLGMGSTFTVELPLHPPGRGAA